VERLAAVGQILDAIEVGFIGLTLEAPDTGRLVFSFANRSAVVLSGLDLPSMMGRYLDEAIPSVQHAGLALIYAEVVRTRVAKWIDRAPIRTEPMAGQIFNIVAVPLDVADAADMVGVVFRNITAEVAAEERIRFQSTLLEVVDVAVIAATLDGRVTFWNPHAERLFEVPSAEAVDRYIADLVTSADTVPVMEAVRRGEAVAERVTITNRSGRTVPIHLTASPLRGADGEVEGIVGISTDITERLRAEEALRESERRMRALLAAIPDVVARCSRDGVLLEVSRPLEILPLVPGMNIRSAVEHGVTPESIDRVLSGLERTARTTSVDTAELVFVTGGGETKHYEVRMVSAGADEVVATLRDVTERRRMELALLASRNELEWRVRARTAELREVNETLRALIDASPLGIVSLEVDGRVRSWNRAAERMFGYTAEEAIGKILPMIPPDDLQTTRAIIATAASGEAPNLVSERLRRHKDGSDVYARVRFATLPAAGDERRAVVALIEDVTESRRLQEAAVRGEERIALLRTVTDAIHRAADIEHLLRALCEPLQSIQIGGGLLSLDLQAPHGEERFAWGVETAAVEDLRIDGSGAATVVRLSTEAAARFPTWTGVPVTSRQGTRGHVLFLSTNPAPFDDDVLHLLRVIGSEIGGAVENIVLFRNMRAAIGVAGTLAKRIATIRESERRHLGRELHDQLGQSLTALKLSLEAVGRRGAPAAEDLHAAARLVSALIAEVRTISLSLRESPFDGALFDALETTIARFAADAGVEIEFVRSGAGGELPRDVELTVYRVVQEALTNVARHAGVTSARVEVAVTARAVTVRIEDAGCGFDARETSSRRTGGLSGMFERMRLVAGTLAIDSEPGRGTRIDAHVPLDDGKHES